VEDRWIPGPHRCQLRGPVPIRSSKGRVRVNSADMTRDGQPVGTVEALEPDGTWVSLQAAPDPVSAPLSPPDGILRSRAGRYAFWRHGHASKPTPCHGQSGPSWRPCQAGRYLCPLRNSSMAKLYVVGGWGGGQAAARRCLVFAPQRKRSGALNTGRAIFLKYFRCSVCSALERTSASISSTKARRKHS